MSYTLEELKEHLKANASEDDLIELLDISVDDLVEYFDYKIERKFEKVLDYFDLSEEEEDV